MCVMPDKKHQNKCRLNIISCNPTSFLSDLYSCKLGYMSLGIMLKSWVKIVIRIINFPAEEVISL